MEGWNLSVESEPEAFVGEIEEDRTAQVFSSGLRFAVQSFDMRRHGEIRDSIQMQFNLVVLGNARHINDELRFAVHASQVQQFRFGALGGSAAAPNRQRIRNFAFAGPGRTANRSQTGANRRGRGERASRFDRPARWSFACRA